MGLKSKHETDFAEHDSLHASLVDFARSVVLWLQVQFAIAVRDNEYLVSSLAIHSLNGADFDISIRE